MAKILLVEDYESIRNAYLFGLTEEGFETDTANSGAEALKKVEATEYDLICLDMVMLQYSGLEFLKAFRAQYPASKSKIIVLSNIDSPSIIEQAKALGIAQYLVKSHYTPKQLAAVIRETLGMPAPTEETAPPTQSGGEA